MALSGSLPQINFGVQEMDITPKKRSKIIVLNEPTSMTVRNIATFFITNGTGSLVPYKGMMNYVKYIEILRSRIVPSIETFDGIFQRDLASSHNSILVQTFMRENKIKVLNWPGNSPNLNPIENLGHILKHRLTKMSCTTIEQMIKSAIQVCVWFHDDEVKSAALANTKTS
ncbi:DDE_3 domain-containing protein [Trichonephila clavipes]|nr:DDE_3 domain-containing protein [Trichonephila clavipes]